MNSEQVGQITSAVIDFLADSKNKEVTEGFAKSLGKSFAEGVKEGFGNTTINDIIKTIDPKVVSDFIAKVDFSPLTDALGKEMKESMVDSISSMGEIIKGTSDRFFYLTIGCTAAAIIASLAPKVIDYVKEYNKKDQGENSQNLIREPDIEEGAMSQNNPSTSVAGGSSNQVTANGNQNTLS